jgi:hypothetical protein
MTTWFPRCALGASVILISACGGPQAPISAVPVPNALSRSWMLPEAKTQDLVYISAEFGSSGASTYILSLPQGKLVGQLSVFGPLCSDSFGNVWIAEASNPYEKGKKLLEYAHGGEKPIRTLHVPNMSAFACAVDPTSGDVAAVGGGHKVDIYNSGSSRPKIVACKLPYLVGLTYDSTGNLFILGGTLGHQKPQVLKIAELPKGATKIEILRGFQTDRRGHSGFEWDGKYLTLGDGLNEGGHEIFRYEIGRNRLKSRGVVELADGDFAYLAHYWIRGSKAVATAWCGSNSACAPIFLYNYPAGGQPIKEIGEGIVPSDGGAVTISVAPRSTPTTRILTRR